MKPNKRLIIFLILSVMGISFTFYAYQVVYTPNILIGPDNQHSRLFIVDDSMTFKGIQKKMHEERIVNDLISFSFLAKLTGYDTEIKPGRYILKPGMSNLEALKLMRSGKQEPVKVTFNNVRLVSELAEKITRNLGMQPSEFEAALMKFCSENKYGFNETNVISMFIPNTYEIYYNTSPERLIEKMHEEYVKFWTEDRLNKAKEAGFTPFEVSTLASIVQAESVRPDEAPIIAGLYINRLKKGIALQADPTLVFAVGDFSLKRVLNEHKEINSPFNTYKFPGLPPGPISMPEIRSIDAVLNYTKSDYYYMCAKEDFSGRHNFTNSYEEHMENAARYQKALTIEQRKGEALRKQQEQ
jgi:UPF0755 protein